MSGLVAAAHPGHSAAATGGKTTTFVLVHGAWHGGWCWKEVAALLRRDGHDVFTPTLTGLADRSHLLSGKVGIGTHVQDVVGLLRWEELRDVVLVGHSYAGNVITGVADGEPARLKALVYLDAAVPSVSDPLPASASSTSSDAGVPPPSCAFFGLPEALWPRVAPRLTPQPQLTRTEPYVPTGAAWTVPRLAYMATPKWQGGERTLKTCRQLAAMPRWETVVRPWAHEMMIEHPDEVAKYLLDFA